MSKTLYEDEKCCYCWGDPRLEDTIISGKLVLSESEIRFEGETDSIAWPKGSILSLTYAPTHPVDLDDYARCCGIEATQDVALGLAEDVVAEPALSIRVRDCEGVYPDGFDVRIVFRNEYYAKVFGKRIKSAFGVPFSGETK